MAGGVERRCRVDDPELLLSPPAWKMRRGSIPLNYFAIVIAGPV